jgi:hypothetical protein
MELKVLTAVEHPSVFEIFGGHGCNRYRSTRPIPTLKALM